MSIDYSSLDETNNKDSTNSYDNLESSVSSSVVLIDGVSSYDTTFTETNSVDHETIKDATNTTNESQLDTQELKTKAVKLAKLVNAKTDVQKIQTIEIFLSPNVADTRVLPFFCLLSKLEIICCKLTSLTGIEHCTNLTVASFTNNQISSIKGIETNLNLQTLNIGENNIHDISCIGKLKYLTELDFHDNYVENISCLSTCTQLNIIRCGNNKIHTLCNQNFDKLINLHTLNIAGNFLLYFQEISLLAKMKNLKNLCLSDPHFGNNPLCEMSNYYTYSLYKLKTTDLLDGIKVSTDATAMAYSTVRKKMMFYQIALSHHASQQRALLKKCFQPLINDTKTLIHQRYKNVFISQQLTQCQQDSCMSESNDNTDSTNFKKLELDFNKLVCELDEDYRLAETAYVVFYIICVSLS